MSLISIDQLVGHLIGDYLLQSGWMANNKAKAHVAALVHCLFYTVGVCGWLTLVGTHVSLPATAVIFGTHFFIDRYRLPKYVIYAREWILPPFKGTPWADCNQQTGFHKGTPDWLAGWLYIITDNALHLLVNCVAVSLWP